MPSVAPETSEVCIGLQSLQAGINSLDHFKRRMGFIEQPIGQRIELRQTLGMSVPRSLAKLAGKAVGRIHNEYAARLAGALSLYADQPENSPIGVVRKSPLRRGMPVVCFLVLAECIPFAWQYGRMRTLPLPDNSAISAKHRVYDFKQLAHANTSRKAILCETHAVSSSDGGTRRHRP